MCHGGGLKCDNRPWTDHKSATLADDIHFSAHNISKFCNDDVSVTAGLFEKKSKRLGTEKTHGQTLFREI